jgi:hypothetical protein
MELKLVSFVKWSYDLTSLISEKLETHFLRENFKLIVNADRQ